MSLLTRLAVVVIALAAAGPCWGADQAAHDRIKRLNQQVVELLSKGEAIRASKLAQEALALAEQTIGENDVLAATTLNNVGGAFQKLGLYAQSEAYQKRGLAILERRLPADHPELATALNNLAFLYAQMGRYADAEPLFKRCLAILEKAHGPEDLEVARTLNNLGLLYRNERRYAEAEPLIKRGLAIVEKKRGPWHISVARSVNSLAALYGDMKRHDEQKKLLERSLAIREKVLGPTDPDLATALDNLATFYTHQEGLFSKAEPLAKRALEIYTAAYGPFHPDVAITTNNLVSIYQGRRQPEEIEKLLRNALEAFEKTAGPKHESVASAADRLANFFFDKGDFARATEFWRRSAAITAERALQDANEIARPVAVGGQKANVEFSSFFTSFIKAAYRAARQDPKAEPALARESFEAAQWVQNSDAAHSLTKMAARGAKGSPALEAMIRDRQGLVDAWRKLDDEHIRALSLPTEARRPAADAGLAAKLAAVARRIADIDGKITADFAEYASLASPAPISVEKVQALLGPDEALVLMLDTDRLFDAPEELFVWVVTKAEVRWTSTEFAGPPFGSLRSSFVGEGARSISGGVKNANVAGAVKALRCGLDEWLWEEQQGDPCRSLLDSPPVAQVSPPWLPFDLARSHSLYRALFGGAEDLIKGRHLLIVPSGPLAQLPFAVLATSLPKGVAAGEYPYDDSYMTVGLWDLEDKDRRRLNWSGKGGVRIATFGAPTPYVFGQTLYHMSASGFARSRPQVPENPAKAAGIRPDDILVKINGEDVATRQAARERIREYPLQAPLHLVVWRDGRLVNIDAPLLGRQINLGWKPLYLQRETARDTPWLVRDHAITVLPAASSLSVLRSLARPSLATKAMVGFGNPLLDGPNRSYDALAKDARKYRVCQDLDAQPRAAAPAAVSRRGGLSKIGMPGGLADVASVLKASPLPETADELCAVARDLKASQGDIYLGARATETEIKRLSEAGQLAQYRIVHFATHGAVAGELNGADEPGLLLTPPTTASQQDDGYLSASEIAGLKLDADWAILSACNTAAGGFKGGEALSGLARAFFYAKARSLLVSNWAVNSEGTVKLVTGAMRRLAASNAMGKAEAMRQAMLEIVDHGEPNEAHPAYWAPFVVVGEGAAGR